MSIDQPIATIQSRPDFEKDAGDVLSNLRSSVANVLASVGGIRKPADLQKAFKLDWTLSWQLFQVAGAGAGPLVPLSAGANVPSRSSLEKFLTVAKNRGVDSIKVGRVLENYHRFEELIELHAGDRSSFNSMITAAGGIDNEWLAADIQHRRNAYRSMSHIIGMQAKAKHRCAILNRGSDPNTWDFAQLFGFVGLRMLRAVPNPLVFRSRLTNTSARQVAKRVGLGSAQHGGYLLPEFSSNPLPPLINREMDAGWLTSQLDNPPVGNMGASTLRFGTGFFDHPLPTPEQDKVFNGDVAVDKPVEVLISDTLVCPGLMPGVRPIAEVFMGNNHSDAPQIPGDIVPVLGNHTVEFLGTGPENLATPDVPDYPEFLRAGAERMGWNIDSFEVWRLRIEFPVYQSTVRVKWKLL